MVIMRYVDQIGGLSGGSELAALAVARHDLHLVHLDELVHLPKLHIVEHECPDVVAESVRVQFAGLECHPGLDPLVEGIVYTFIELQQHLEGQSGRDLSVLQGENPGLHCDAPASCHHIVGERPPLT